MDINTISSSKENDYIYSCIKLAPIAIAIVRVDFSLKTKAVIAKFDYINSEFSKLKNISAKIMSNVSPCSISSKSEDELLSVFYDVAYNKKIFKFKERDKKTNKYLEFQLYQSKLGFCVCMLTDITKINELEKSNNLLKKELKKDELTDLLNRKYFISQTKKYINNYKDYRRICALFIIDIDNFKLINDLYGHQYGDELLIKLSLRLKGSFDSDALIGRLGGDEFIILMKNIKSIPDVEKKADFLCRQLSIPVKDKKITCSIGVTIVSEKNSEFEELYNQADNAMYTAKKRGKCQYYIEQNKNINN